MKAQEIIDVEFSEYQLEYIDKACHDNPNDDHRYNGKTGATRSGKTTLDYMYVIPYRIIVREGLGGEIAITGVSLGTINRNVLEPMRNYWAGKGFDKVISDTHKDVAGNTYVTIFGNKVYLLGMEKVNAVAKLRGAEFKYVYCDELAECNEEAFGLLKSRLSKEWSCCDFTCNPKSDTHWLYYFINSKIDIYVQKYTLFDNPFLSKKFVDALVQEYASSDVLTARYIYGLWKKAEGLVYTKLASNIKDYTLYEYDFSKIQRYVMGIDFGGNMSAHTFALCGMTRNFDNIVFLESERISAKGMDGNELCDRLEQFVNEVRAKYKITGAIECYCDSAEQTLINSIRNRVMVKHLGLIVNNAKKRPIKDRINLINRLLGAKKIYWMFSAQTSLQAMATCVYDDRDGHQDERLDNNTTDIDSVDCSEYCVEPFMADLLRLLEFRTGGLRQ